MADVRLIEIDEDNWLEAAQLQIRPEQQRFVAPAVGILARAYAMRASHARVWGVEAEGTLVGLVMVRELAQEPACYELQQVLIGVQHQNRGHAQAAIRQALELLRSEGRYDKVELCVHREDAAALHVYQKLGFADTGYVDPDLPECLCLVYRFAGRSGDA